MGGRYVKGFGEAQWERVERARRERIFTSVEDFAQRTGLGKEPMTRLAEAGALAGLERNRRVAIWGVRGVVRGDGPELAIEEREARPALLELDEFETISWDYRTSRHSPRGHPLAPLRETLAARRLPDARAVACMRDGQRVRYAGIVICRQRPGTASGVVFLTLEDETGFVNVVIWSKVFESHAVLVKTASFLGVTGKLQVQDDVVHVIAESFWKPPVPLRPESGGSHDFH